MSTVFTDTTTAQWTPSTPLMTSATWLLEALAGLGRLRSLPANWDSYGSAPITESAEASCRLLLLSLARARVAAPDILPVSGGGLQLEWRLRDRELEIGILPDGRPEFLAVFEGNDMREGELPPHRPDSAPFLFDLVFGART